MIHQRHRQTDRQTTCDRKSALCTIVHRAVKTRAVVSTCITGTSITLHNHVTFTFEGSDLLTPGSVHADRLLRTTVCTSVHFGIDSSSRFFLLDRPPTRKTISKKVHENRVGCCGSWWTKEAEWGGVIGDHGGYQCFFRYRLTRVVPDKGP